MSAPAPIDDAIFPSEFDPSLLSVGSKRKFGSKDDWSMEVFYDGLPLQLQTPWMRNVFGLTSYTNQGGRTSYSLSWELEKQGDVMEFTKFLLELDNWFKKFLEEEGVSLPYHSSVRPCNKFDETGQPRYNDTFRVKLKQKFDNFACTLMDNNLVVARWPVQDESRIQRSDVCRMIIELLPVWCAGGRVGTTWKVATIQKQRAVTNFRLDP